MDRISRAFICFIMAALLLVVGVTIGHCENWYLLIYTDGSANLDSLTPTQKQELSAKYVPQAVLDSPQWAAATAAQKWEYVKAECLPPRLASRIQNEGMLPILKDAAGKMEIVEQYWKLASEGTKSVFMLYLDVEGAQAVNIKTWLDAQVGAGFRYWYGRTMCAVKKQMWDSRADAITLAVAKRVLKYPVEVLDSESGQMVTRYPLLGEAMAQGVTIDPAIILKCEDALLPRKIFDGSK